MDKSVDHEIYYELCEQFTDEATLAHRRKVLPTRMLKFSMPDIDITYQAIGTELLDSGQPQKSIPLLKKATIIDPHNVFSQKALAKAFFDLEKDDEAFSFIKKALSISPESSRLHKFLIETLEKKNRLEDIESFTKDIVNLIENPESVPAFYFKRAEALLNDAKFPQALVMYRKAMESNPPMKYGEHFDYGVALYYEGLFEEALVQFEHAKNLNPDSNHTVNNIAHLNYCLGRVEKAQEEYQYIMANRLETSLTVTNFLLLLYHLDQDEDSIKECQDRLKQSMTPSGSGLRKLFQDQLRITQGILQKDDIDETIREFNLKKIKGINLVLSFINEKKKILNEEHKTDLVDSDF